ncbi:MAG TPA: SAM-dependent methyltransferase, partial [Mycobacterium sp.]|nr:SAM-dependent methyltransferase [Mycobacterium sp.]
QALPKAKLWSVMERLHVMAACHFFMACHTDRPKESYAVDFSTAGWLEYVPMMRTRCGLDGTQVYRPRCRRTLNPAQLPFVQNVDGRRSIREIAAAVMHSGEPRRASQADIEDFARRLFESLWLDDFVAMGRGR